MTLKKIVIVLIISIILFCAVIQTVGQTEPKKTASLPRSYKSILLGMQIEAFKQNAAQDRIVVEGELPVYFNQPQKNVFKATYLPLFLKILFYFYENSLMLMTFIYNDKQITVYEQYRRLQSKYGTPETNLDQFVWKDEKTIIILERKPFIMKVMDASYFSVLLKEKEQSNKILQESIDQSLDQF